MVTGFLTLYLIAFFACIITLLDWLGRRHDRRLRQQKPPVN